jgi:hypothetical protein
MTMADETTPVTPVFLLADSDYSALGKFISDNIVANNAGNQHVTKEDWLAIIAIIAKYNEP